MCANGVGYGVGVGVGVVLWCVLCVSGRLYFATFVIICQFVMLNLFVMVIVENFDEMQLDMVGDNLLLNYYL